MELLVGKIIKCQHLQTASGLVMLALTLVSILVTNGVILSLWPSGLFLGYPRSYCPDRTLAGAPKGQHTRPSLLEAYVEFWPHKNRTLEQPTVRYPHVIKRMCIVGERNSGTTWFQRTLNLNFHEADPPHLGLASSQCFRLKHWFHFPELIGPLIQVCVVCTCPHRKRLVALQSPSDGTSQYRFTCSELTRSCEQEKSAVSRDEVCELAV